MALPSLRGLLQPWLPWLPPRNLPGASGEPLGSFLGITKGSVWGLVLGSFMCTSMSGLMISRLGLRAYRKYHVSWEIHKGPTIRSQTDSVVRIAPAFQKIELPGIIFCLSCCLRGFIFCISDSSAKVIEQH